MPIASYGDGWFGNTYQGSAQHPGCYAYFSTSFVTASATSKGVGYYSDTDCSQMIDGAGGFPLPFINLTATTKIAIKFEYMNPKSYQIISAGPDTLFGNAYKFPAKGGQLNLTTGVPVNPSDIPNNPGSADNFTNFFYGRISDS